MQMFLEMKVNQFFLTAFTVLEQRVSSQIVRIQHCTCAVIRMMWPSFVIVSVLYCICGMLMLSTTFFLFFSFFCDIAASECATENAGCDHYCTETLYSYTCSCYPGYTLEHDGHTCIGKNSILLNLYFI